MRLATRYPFLGTLRLSILRDQVRRDVLSDMLIRDTAFKLDRSRKEAEEDVPEEDDYEASELIPNLQLTHEMTLTKLFVKAC
mmetsp:Transcript_4251/g.11802  ORF Transcript_4251/g.11802 Transcript_4251/m.11802 type:complete len:82 (+) Transcript_4251:306-551(+)